MKIDKITIVGGGSAGWMTAATLIKFFPNKNISLIESPNVPIIGVGESTLLHIKSWLYSLGIKEDFMKDTDATYKLSIKFTDFYKKGESFHYPFGEPNFENNVNGFNDWWFKKFLLPNTPYSDFAECMFPQMSYVNNKTYNKNIPSAYHFDATKFGQWLKDKFCIPKGVKYIEENIVDISVNENGIYKLNNKHTADLFIDCTGFNALLLKKINTPFRSLENILPNNSAWATRIPYDNKREQLVSYTNCTAYNNGWIWNIPLWSRIGTGYVYSDKFIDDDSALKEFKQYLNKEDLEFKKIKMKTGLHEKVWNKNVCGIGLAAGFIEPLESNGLFSVHEFLHILVRNLQRDNVSQFDKDNFNHNCKIIFYNFVDFVVLHYALSHRDDTEYWKNNLNKEWSTDLNNLKPTSLNGIVDIVRQQNFSYYFDHPGWASICAGMHWGPTDIPSILKYNLNKSLDSFKKDWLIISQNLNSKKNQWDKESKKHSFLYDVINEYHR